MMDTPKILIIEDNAISRKILKNTLESANYHVVDVENGETALAKAEKHKFDLIIQDLFLPDMDGFTLNKKLRDIPNAKNIPVFALSGFLTQLEEQAKNAGFTAFLFKPIEPTHLLNTVKAHLSIAKSPKKSVKKRIPLVNDRPELARRCALLMSQLNLIGGIANTLVSGAKNADESEALKEGLHYCLDATGITKGALYINKSPEGMHLSQHVGFADEQEEKITSFFGVKDLIPDIVQKNKPLAIPSDECSGLHAENFLKEANVKSALILPLFSGEECLGILFLGSNLTNLSDVSVREFVKTLGMQFGQSIALTSAFQKVGSSEKKYRELIDTLPDAIFIQQDEKFVYANQAARSLLNANTDNDLTSRSLYDFFPDDYQDTIKKFMQKNHTQAFVPLPEGRVINLDGHHLDVEIMLSPFQHNNKDAVYMMMRNITERKRSALQLKLQYQIAWILAESETLFVATVKILKIICEGMKWDCGTIWALDKSENILRCTRTWQSPEIKSDAFQKENKKLTYQIGVGIPGLTWKTQKAVWKTNILDDRDFLRKDSATEVGLNTAIAFPIICEEEVLGVIEFFTRKTRQPDRDSLGWFESIGNQLGLFIKRKHMEKQMLYLAEHDVLTGLSNRSLLEQCLTTSLVAAKEKHKKLAVLFLDIDHFKDVNDSMGHESGDLLLKEISERLRYCLRPGDCIGRLGGDEFVIILPEVSEKNEIIDVISRIQQQLVNHITIMKKTLLITVSIGISRYPEDGDSTHHLIKGADTAMYEAKEKGRNNYQFCTREMTSRAEKRGTLQTDLHQAIKNHEFILYYQPKISAITKKISGMEGLIRWKKNNTIIMPENFISAVENSDLITPLSEWVLKTACLQNKSWQTTGLPPLTMSVNLSVRNLNAQLLQEMERILNETNLAPHTFEIELTESVLMENVENNLIILSSLKDMGLKISLDDFGTGYSSLSYLKRFPIDTIKIDQLFVRDIATDSSDAAIAIAIIAMSRSLGFKVIAEGVETEAQLKFLCEHGCDEMQGYYFSEALPAEEATQFIMKGDPVWPF